MRSIRLTFTDDEYALLEEEAKLRSMPVSTFVKHMVMLQVAPRIKYNAQILLQKAESQLQNINVNEPFIVSSLLPVEWPSLTKSQKMLVSKQLVKWVEESNSQFSKLEEKYQGKTNKYIRNY